MRRYTNIIMKELTEKSGGSVEKKIHLIPIEYRYKNRSPESLEMLKDDWKKLSPQQVRKLYNEIYTETFFSNRLRAKNVDKTWHLMCFVALLLIVAFNFREPIYYFYFTMFHGLDEYMRIRDSDFYFAVECDLYAIDYSISSKRPRNHPYHYNPSIKQRIPSDDMLNIERHFN